MNVILCRVFLVWLVSIKLSWIDNLLGQFRRSGANNKPRVLTPRDCVVLTPTSFWDTHDTNLTLKHFTALKLYHLKFTLVTATTNTRTRHTPSSDLNVRLSQYNMATTSPQTSARKRSVSLGCPLVGWVVVGTNLDAEVLNFTLPSPEQTCGIYVTTRRPYSKHPPQTRNRGLLLMETWPATIVPNRLLREFYDTSINAFNT